MKTWKAGERTDADLIDDMLKDVPDEELGIEPKRRTKSQPKKADPATRGVDINDLYRKGKADLATANSKNEALTAKVAELKQKFKD